ncbi:hypothetical protein [Hyalangium sp.]|uniref:glycoside hydrolase family 130 protein n=1 Tax=Hyalangium sp. TaxID=2028555 RepID=UPI0039C85BBB
MWYSAGDSTERIGRATSLDGTNWTRDAANPILSPGSGWESSQVGRPSVIRIGRMYYMFYGGYDGTSWRVGLATSWDGSSWTKLGSNPVWQIAPGTYMSMYIYPGGILIEGDRLWAWFSGHDGARYSVGAAAMDLQ